MTTGERSFGSGGAPICASVRTVPRTVFSTRWAAALGPRRRSRRSSVAILIRSARTCVTFLRKRCVELLIQGVEVLHRPSQYATDLQKCVHSLEDIEEAGSPEYELVIFGGLGGRLDQTMHTLHVLWQLAPNVPVGEIIPEPEEPGKAPPRGSHLRKRARTLVVSENCVTCLLSAGEHDLRHNRKILGKSCGVLPLGSGPPGARVHTQGLEWNLGTCTADHRGRPFVFGWVLFVEQPSCTGQYGRHGSHWRRCARVLDRRAEAGSVIYRPRNWHCAASHYGRVLQYYRAV